MADIPQIEPVSLHENSDLHMASLNAAQDSTHAGSAAVPIVATSDPAFNDTPQTPLSTAPGHLVPGIAPPLLTPQHSNLRDAAALDTPPPSGGLRRLDSSNMEDLQMEGGLPSIQATHEDVIPGLQLSHHETVPSWGNKKAQEEYEIAREKLVDQNFTLEWVGDHYDESDMWDNPEHTLYVPANLESNMQS